MTEKDPQKEPAPGGAPAAPATPAQPATPASPAEGQGVDPDDDGGRGVPAIPDPK